MLKKIAYILIVLALPLVVWGYYGLFTKAGNKQYDEMDGMWPFFGLVGAAVLVFISIILLIWQRMKR